MAQAKDKEQLKKAKKKAKASSGDVLTSVSDYCQGILGKLGDTFSARNKTGLILAILALLLSLFACASILSFVWSGANDLSLLQQLSDGVTIPEEEMVFSNLTNRWGAMLSDFLVNKLIGLSILIPLYFLARLALSLIFPQWIRLGRRQLLKDICVATLATLLGIIGLSWLQQSIWAESQWCSHLLLGGVSGRNMLAFCLGHIGAFGTLLLLLFMLVSIIIIRVSKDTLESMRTQWNNKEEEESEDEDSAREDSEQGKPRGLWGRIRSLFSWISISASIRRVDKLDDEDEAEEETQTRETPSSAIATQPTTPTEAETEDEEEPYIEVTQVSSTPYSTPPTSQTTNGATIVSVDGQSASTASSGAGLTIERAPEDDLVSPEELNPTASLQPGMLLGNFQLPPTDLLQEYGQEQEGHNPAEIEQNMQTIITTLREFKKQVRPHKVTIGPTVTLYEIIPEAGVMVSSIRNLAEDISRALKSDRSVRIIAPMPSTGTVGIEVPNSNPQVVSMRSLITSRKFNELKEKMELPIAIGKTITNEPFIFDLAKSPHLLIAGATGQGKSVGLNALITSLLYSKRPEELKLVMIDPKMVEFSLYEHLANHYLAAIPGSSKAIITEMDRVVPTLNSLCLEMDNRLQFIAQYNVRGVKDYNEAVRSGKLRRIDGHEIIPSIVLIIDEYADLVMTAGKEVEQPITRLGQKARAAGIHVVIATQRPTVNVITGLIKANFPARIAFKVVQAKDSQTILDTTGANSLIGRGDMLYVNGGEPQRLQCAFVDTPECEAIVAHIQRQESFGHPHQLPEAIVEGESSAKVFNPNEKDPLFDDVARMIVSTQVGSTSNIQRKYNIGYNRAGRLMDQLEGAGIVGPQEGSKPREVYIQDQDSLDHLLSQLR